MDFLVVTDPRKESYSEKRLSPKMRMYSVSRARLALGVFNHGNIRVISHYRDDFSCFGIMKVAPLPKLDTEE